MALKNLARQQILFLKNGKFKQKIFNQGKFMKKLSNEEMKAAKEANKNAFLNSATRYFTQESITSRLLNIPAAGQFLFIKIWAKKASKTQAIKAKCLDCVCHQKDEITKCTVKLCPLWHFRPYQE